MSTPNNPSASPSNTESQGSDRLPFEGVRGAYGGGVRVPAGLDVRNPEHLAAWSKHLSDVRAAEEAARPHFDPNTLGDTSWMNLTDYNTTKPEYATPQPAKRSFGSRIIGLIRGKSH